MNSYMDTESEQTLDESNLFIYRQLVIELSRILVIIEHTSAPYKMLRWTCIHRPGGDGGVSGELSDRHTHIHPSEQPVRGRVIQNPSCLVFIFSVILSCDY